MTTDASGGYQPPGTERPLGSVSGPGSSGSTTDTAKDQAGQVNQTAKEKGTEVASTAADQAKNVAGETKNQARELWHQTQSQVREQAGTQKDKAAGGLRSISDELRSMADGTSMGQSGMVNDLARQASEKMHGIAGWLDSREPGDLIEDIRDLARRKPGSFLLGAAVAGALAGRLTRGTIDAKRDESGASPAYDTTNATTGTGMYGGGAPAGTADGAPWTGAGSTPGSAEDVIVVEEAVVVETDPFGARPQRSTVGGGRE